MSNVDTVIAKFAAEMKAAIIADLIGATGETGPGPSKKTEPKAKPGPKPKAEAAPKKRTRVWTPEQLAKRAATIAANKAAKAERAAKDAAPLFVSDGDEPATA